MSVYCDFCGTICKDMDDYMRTHAGTCGWDPEQRIWVPDEKRAREILSAFVEAHDGTP